MKFKDTILPGFILTIVLLILYSVIEILYTIDLLLETIIGFSIIILIALVISTIFYLTSKLIGEEKE